MAENHTTRRAVLPRDRGGSIELKEGTGGILAACPCDDFLEIYKKDVTFRLETPETIDPERTNPNAPMVAAVADRIGCADPVIARVLLQGRDIIESAFLVEPVDKKGVVRSLHSIKEALVACRKSADLVRRRVEEIVAQIEQSGVDKDRFGRSVPSLPQVPDLELAATQFLISAKRAIKGTCNLVPLFVDTDRADSNFDHLGNRLDKLLGGDAPLVRFVRAHADAIAYLIDLRNCQEHPQPGKSTRIDNFRIEPDGSIRVPMWFVTGETPRPIHVEMGAAIDLLVEITEWLVIYLADHRLDSRWPFVIEEVDEESINRDMPVRYRLTLDIGKLNLPEPSGSAGSDPPAA